MYGINRTLLKTLLVVVFVTVAVAQSLEPPLSDTRLTHHTLVREDIFAGFLTDDMERFARGEKNIQLLIEKRPGAKADLLAWKGGATLYRAVRAHENKRSDEFQKYYREALDLFSQARQLQPEGDGVAAVTGGSLVVFADRLPKENRAAAWSQAYDAYQTLWKHQAPIVERLPVHIRGELLGGLAQSALRTGRTEEATQYLDKILTLLRDTPYEPIAKQWKANPKAAADNSITCMTCHDGGRLAARLATLNK
jgi:tetratricopeptide (TPR) repeat protein